MPLSSAEKAKVRHYLGADVLNLNTDERKIRLEGAMDVLGQDADMLAMVQAPLTAVPPGFLARLDDVEVKLLDAHGRLQVSRVDTIELNAAEIEQLRSEGRRAVASLSSLLGVGPYSDVFGEASIGIGGGDSTYAWGGT